MNLLLQSLRVLWKAWLFIVFALSMVVSYPLFAFLLRKQSRFYRAFHLMRLWSLTLTAFCGIFVRVKKQASLPDGPFIICPNHGSYLDIITMYRVFSRYFLFMGKVEILNWPLFHIFFSSGMNIAVHRQSKREAHRALLKARDEVKKGHNIVIFPEGTIPPTAPKMRAFKNGAFRLSLEENIPIVPVTFLNNWRRLEAGPVLKNLGGPGFSDVIIHAPVFPSEYAEKGEVQYKLDIFETIEKPLRERYGY